MMKGMVLKPPFLVFDFAAWWGRLSSFEIMHFSLPLCAPWLWLLDGSSIGKTKKTNKETKKEKSLSFGYKSFPMICYSLLKQFSTFHMPKKDRLQKVLCRVDLSLWSKGELRKWLLVKGYYNLFKLQLGDLGSHINLIFSHATIMI